MFKQLSNRVRVSSYKMPIGINQGVCMAGLGISVGLSKSITIVATLKMRINKFKVLGQLA